MNYFKEYFCNDMNCLTPFCSIDCMYKFITLIYSFKRKWIIYSTVQIIPPKMVAPEVPYVKLGDSIDKPCGVNCFLYPEKNVIVSSPNDQFKSRLYLILFFPSLHPGHLMILKIYFLSLIMHLTLLLVILLYSVREHAMRYLVYLSL